MTHVDKPCIRGTLETVLYAEDLAAARAFYSDVMGLEVVWQSEDLSVGFRIAPEQVLLVFNPGESTAAGRSVPSHGARGEGHVAFLIAADAYDAWLAHLRVCGVAVEQEYGWAEGRRSIYVRDPAGNSVELITGDIW